eukprot:CAMPEP_0195056098 /NCGR_PEP_ID=MMETSP0448-20130528/4639_1 /TAXON_ID=66468 /ORGANISM="Heterocapsa triquestra, Strain CCMP 448" /LENGTH=378 /DNA_ID=CAMNT_0040085889 /DNA_START=44 /DNA_END=1180 /DNA_ORIENTATION=+
MPTQWEVIGGADKGGIVVREGQALSSAQTADRLSTGALVEELQLAGERLQYKLITGTGPATGWVSLKVSGKELLAKKGDAPAAPLSPEELKKRVLADAEAKQKDGMLPKYCMKYKVLGFPLPEPKLRIFCFHNAGSAESTFTGASPFISWAKENKAVEIVAFDYPGRNHLRKEPKHTSTATLAPDLLAVAHEKLTDGVPYIIWGHSVGTWVSFEFMQCARMMGLPMPLAAFWMAFPAPHMPEDQRNWNKNKGMTEDQFKVELKNWDVGHFDGAGKVVFDDPVWSDEKDKLRADFQLFDEYKFTHQDSPKFDFPIHAWHFEGEHYNKPEQIELWKDWTSNDFDFQIMKGMGHLTCVYKMAEKKEYFQKVVDQMKKYSGL